MINPLKKYETLQKACDAVGFDIEIPNRYKLKDIFVISNKILELRFSSITVRKASYDNKITGLNGISGVYLGAYPNECIKLDFKTETGKGYEYWNGSALKPKAYLAVWDDLQHKFSYSVYAKDGISPKIMENWLKNFK